jgi:hypothetical protein
MVFAHQKRHLLETEGEIEMENRASRNLFHWLTRPTVRAHRAPSDAKAGNPGLALQQVELTDAPSISLSPATAEPGSRVTVKGEGFSAGETVNIFLSTSSISTSRPAASAQVRADGTFAHSFTLPLTWPNGRRIVASALKLTAATPDFSQRAVTELGLTFNIRFQLEQAIEHLWTGAPADVTDDAGDMALPTRRSLCDGDSDPMLEWRFSEHNGKPVYVSIPVQPRWVGSTM